MDKIATNNFMVALRKDVKASKAMVAGNLTRKISKLKQELEKADKDTEQKAKIENKIEKVHSDIKLLKTIDIYKISKDAMIKPDLEFWNKLIGDSKASNEERLEARVISKTRIQKQVQKFRSQHVDCGEWLEEYFEFREKKKDLMEATQSGKKKKMRRDRVKEAREKRNKLRSQRKLLHENSPRKVSESSVQSESEVVHPSWASKRREKELLKKAFSGISKIAEGPQETKRVVFNAE